MILLVTCWIVAAELLVVSSPHGVLEWAAAGVTALGLMLLWHADAAAKAVRARTESGDALWDRVDGERHPAAEGLDERQRLHLLGSLEDHGRWRGIDRIVHDDDAEDAEDADRDDDWWADAFHYRAADESDGEPAGGTAGPGTPSRACIES